MGPLRGDGNLDGPRSFERQRKVEKMGPLRGDGNLSSALKYSKAYS